MHQIRMLQIYLGLGILTTSVNSQAGTICRKYDDLDNQEYTEEVIILHQPTYAESSTRCSDSNRNEADLELTNHNNHCSPNPCKNDGKCFSDDDDYACKCQRGYLGRNCSITSLECTVIPASAHASSSTNLTSLFVGESITYTCNAGYRIVGTSLDKQTLTCRNDGTWTSEKAPECEFTDCLVGVKNGKVNNSQMTASSVWNDKYVASNGRLDKAADASSGGCWIPTEKLAQSAGQWLQVDLLVPTYVTGVVTQGRPGATYINWITKYKIAYGNSTGSLQKIEGKNKTEKIFDGNWDNDSYVINYFPQPITARYFRLIVEAWQRHTALRLDYLTC